MRFFYFLCAWASVIGVFCSYACHLLIGAYVTSHLLTAYLLLAGVALGIALWLFLASRIPVGIPERLFYLRSVELSWGLGFLLGLVIASW